MNVGTRSPGAGPAGPRRSEDGMSGKRKKGSAEAAPRAYVRLTRHERDTVQRILERRASCREIATELGRSPSTVSAEVASHRFVTTPKSRRGIDDDEPAAAARLEAIRDCLRRRLSPEQMAARNGGPVDLSPSTIYRWVSAVSANLKLTTFANASRRMR
ncbi:helix-turn-helix domain-containing protein [Collinsella sp. LCP21S3_C7]|uniref:helix-turn-helix domain-containing protein n=1 Tax=Collinsella sp. LCP21S3_C7 TaxID=3438772 RepID=UPI003F91CE3C